MRCGLIKNVAAIADQIAVIELAGISEMIGTAVTPFYLALAT